MTEQRLLNMATNIGYYLLENGAETYRVEDSVVYVLSAYDAKDISVFAIPTYIIVSFTTSTGKSLTKSKRLRSRGLNINYIIELNALCREITATKPSIDYIEEHLNSIMNSPTYSVKLQTFANALVAFCFTLFFGGALNDSIFSAVIGIFMKYLTAIMNRFRMNPFTTTTLNSYLIAFVAILSTRYLFCDNSSAIIIGCFMLLVPGVAITNAARDFIVGDVLSGTIRLFEAFLIATSIALGSGIAITMWRH